MTSPHRRGLSARRVARPLFSRQTVASLLTAAILLAGAPFRHFLPVIRTAHAQKAQAVPAFACAPAFTDPGDVGTGDSLSSVAVGDFNNDGRLDFATANYDTDNVTIRLGGCNHAAPTVAINQAAGQADPTNTSPVNFTVVFSEPVTGFAAGGVTLSGTAGATTATVMGSGTTYNVAVSGMTSKGRGND